MIGPEFELPAPPTSWTMRDRRFLLHGYADGANQASVYDRALGGYVRASDYGWLRPRVRHACDHDGRHRGCEDVDGTQNRAGGDGCASR